MLIAFSGRTTDCQERVTAIAGGYECWNVRAFEFDEFIDQIKLRIPPVNSNVLHNYRIEHSGNKPFGIREQDFKTASWALVIPECVEDAVAASFAETMFLLDLYSPKFLDPIFFVSDFGVTRLPDRPLSPYARFDVDRSELLKRPEFVSFFQSLLPQSQYGSWQLNRSQVWNKEDWRLFVAAFLYAGLRDYEDSKNPLGWQRESADIASLLEALFTAADTTTEEIGYRLRKRMAALLSERFPSVESDVKELYADRSAFVHGSFFAEIAKQTRKTDGDLPIPDYELLYKHKEYARWALAAYLRLALSLKSEPKRYAGCRNVMDALERAIIDVDLRRQIVLEAETVWSVLPSPT